MGRKGFTLIELIAVIAVLVLVTGVLVTMFLAGSDIFSSEKDISDIMLEGNRAMETMSDEIRSSRQVLTAQDTSCSFWLEDLNNNGTMEAGETVAYSWDGTAGGDLIRTAAGVSSVLSKYVDGCSFTYDSGTLSLITTVTLSLSLSSGSREKTFGSTIRIRNS